jgi:eukaryotic-like serine/threonine-protein kinase
MTHYTSWSLEALQAKDQGMRLRAEQGDAAALPQFKRTVELDPNLADAYLNLAVIYRDSGTALGTSYATTAFNLRERLSQRSRWLTEAVYYTYTGELEKANATYVQWLQNFPADPALHRYFSSWLTTLGQHERAGLEGHEAVRLNPSIVTYYNLMAPLIRMNRLEEAKAVFEEARARGIDELSLRDQRYKVAFLEHDSAGMQEQISWAMRNPETKEWRYYSKVRPRLTWDASELRAYFILRRAPLCLIRPHSGNHSMTRHSCLSSPTPRSEMSKQVILFGPGESRKRHS